MKRNSFLVAIFFLLLINTSHSVFAMEMMDTSSISISPPLSPIVTMENKEVQYELPYPGLLPDNPLYPLKILRDNVVNFFISDPVKKAEYAISQADKHINASVYLSNEKKVNDVLIASAVATAITYCDKAVTQISLAKQQQGNSNNVIQHMDIALQKYNTVILQLKTKASSKLKNDLVREQKRLYSLQMTIKLLKKQ